MNHHPVIRHPNMNHYRNPVLHQNMNHHRDITSCHKMNHHYTMCHLSMTHQTMTRHHNTLVELMRLPQNLTKSIEDCKATYVERTDLYCKECKGIVIDATRIECCDPATNSTYCQICSNKMVTQKKRCPHFLCHMETIESLVKDRD